MLHRSLVGLAIVFCVAAVHEWLLGLHSVQPISIAVSACVVVVFGLGSMRHPWFFLSVVLALWVVMPQVHDDSNHELLVGGYHLAWLIGTPVGWALRPIEHSRPSIGVDGDSPKAIRS